MQATSILRAEHDAILEKLRALRAAAEPELFDYFRDVMDAKHHAKEERVLFPALIAAGLPVFGGPIAVMLSEHDHGRRLLEDLRAAPSPATASAFADFLESHIAKENNVLFLIADRLLGDDEDARLVAAFAELA